MYTLFDIEIGNKYYYYYYYDENWHIMIFGTIPPISIIKMLYPESF